MVKKRKGIGYIIEAITALMVLFIFVSGNTPAEPETDWNTFQQEIMGQDLTLVMEKTEDIDDFIRNGETGTLVTAAETLSRDQLSVSGTVENVPISTQVVGFHVLEGDQENVTLDTVQDLNDQCHQDDDLEEIESEDNTDILRSENSRDGAYLYVADTDPDISGGNDDTDYDSLWVDNGTRCQFSAAEGPHYIDEFFYWGDSPGEEHYDINEIYSDDEELELFLASQVVDLKPALESRMNGIDTGIVVDTMDARRHDLGVYDILIFRERQAVKDPDSVLNEERERVQDFLSDGSILLMMDLKKEDFYDGNTPEDNFLTDTGMKWVDLGYRNEPADPAEGSFNRNSDSKNLKTYFKGMSGDPSQIDLRSSGNITSSNGQYFKDSGPLLSTGTGAYDRSEWNATNYSMDQADPDVIEGYPDTECVDSGKSTALTWGEFEFHDYQSDSFNQYDVINTELGESETFCNNNDVRALNIDFDDDEDYSEENEGPYLNGETVIVENKSFTVNFPSEEAVETGTIAEFVYTGESDIESINYRTSFEGFEGRKLARMGYKTDYKTEGKKMISSVVQWLSEDSVEFGARKNSEISTEAIGGVKENTFIPYKIILRWRQ